MKILFFDIQITGHHSEYIGHLIDCLKTSNDANEYYFIVHPNFSHEFPIISSIAKSIKNVNWVEIKGDELKNLQHLGMVKKSFMSYRLMHRYAIRFKVSHVCLLYFNTFQLAFCFFKPRYTTSGILFLQFYRMSKNTGKEKLKYYRKYLTTKLYTLNPKLKKIFILNDNKTAVYLNNEFNTNIFEMLPDPIPDLRSLDNFDIYSYYNIDRNSKIFLHIGALGNRKGTFGIIKSALFLPREKQKNITILLAGCASNKETEALMFEEIAASIKNSDVNIVWDNQFVSNAHMKSLFDQCYVVLMPYKNAEASSGILGHAIKAKKRVIVSNRGLLKEIVDENDFGYLLNRVDAKNIAEKINATFEMDHTRMSNENYVKNHTPLNFSKSILNSINK